jgi:hypothetical protein
MAPALGLLDLQQLCSLNVHEKQGIRLGVKTALRKCVHWHVFPNNWMTQLKDGNPACE